MQEEGEWERPGMREPMVPRMEPRGPVGGAAGGLAAAFGNAGAAFFFSSSSFCSRTRTRQSGSGRGGARVEKVKGLPGSAAWQRTQGCWRAAARADAHRDTRWPPLGSHWSARTHWPQQSST